MKKIALMASLILTMQGALAQNNSSTASQYGNDNYARVSQTGHDNSADQEQHNSGTLMIEQIGGSNEAYQDQIDLYTEDAIASILQDGDYNTAVQYQTGNSAPSLHEAYISQNGNNNYASQIQTNAYWGDGFYSSITQTGNYNYAETYQADGTLNKAEIMSLGDYNGTETDPISIYQSGDNNTGVIYQEGDYNSASIKQVGNDNYAKVEQYGDNLKSLPIEQIGNGITIIITQN